MRSLLSALVVLGLGGTLLAEETTYRPALSMTGKGGIVVAPSARTVSTSSYALTGEDNREVISYSYTYADASHHTGIILTPNYRSDTNP